MNASHNLEVTTVGDRQLRMVRHFDAPRERVFDALTKPELVKRWLYGPEGHSLPVCEIDLTEGGKMRYVWRLANGTDMGLSGRYVEIVRPERIVHTEVFDEDWTGGETTVTTELEEFDGKTKLTMTILYASTETRDMVLETGMSEGVGMGFDRLGTLLGS